MRKIVLFCTFMVHALFMNAQGEFICKTPEAEPPLPVYSNSIDPVYLNSFDPVVFNIYFWKILDSEGNVAPGYPDITEADVLAAVASLNIEYNKINIFFKYDGLGEIVSPPDLNVRIFDPQLGYCTELMEIDPHGYGWLNSCEITPFNNFVSSNGYIRNNSFNVYVPYSMDFGGSANYNSTKLFISPYVLDGFAFIHEIGHCFDLIHTWEHYNNAQVERITRNTSDPEYNAGDEGIGDEVVDTGSVPNFRSEYCYVNGGTDSNCDDNPNYLPYAYINQNGCFHLFSGAKNIFDEIFEPAEADVRNIMGYTPVACRSEFTVGQGIRMREAIEIDVHTNFAQAATDISRLYEPYKGEYFLAGPIQDHDEKPLFQPGFEYRFVECEGPYPQPSAYEDISFPSNNQNVVLLIDKDETNYDNITHPNHSAIYLNHDHPIFSPQARKCYDNFNRNPSSGSVIRFNDNILNTNITTTQVDSLGINNQNLVNDLPNGLYKVEKNYEDGAVQETVIMKGN